MQDQTSLATDALLEQEPQISSETTDQPTDAGQPEQTKEMSEIEKLINKRTGFWSLGLEIGDIKWIKNQCNSKFTFTGPNEAFMLMNCYLGFASALSRYEQAEKEGLETEAPIVQAAALEACALMINRYQGATLDGAQRIFRIAIALNSPIMEMKKLDEEIAALRAQDKEQA